jgi:2-haloacid dehalogenase
MAFDSDRVETVTFDSYSTLVDVTAARKALADRVPNPDAVSETWRARSLMYTFVADALDAYQPFYDVLRAALADALAANDAGVPEREREEILAVYLELDVFDDVQDALARLDAVGYDCYVVSNGDPEMLASMVDHAGIESLVADAVSADEVETFKPAPEFYRHAAGRVGTPIGRIAHVTAGWFDVLGAAHAGMQSVWVNRAGDDWVSVGGDPDLTVSTLTALAAELGA